MDYLSEDDMISLMSKMTVKTLLRFIRTSQFHKGLFKHTFIDLCKSLSDDELAWIRSHGDELAKTITRHELLNRHPQLVPLTYETIRIAIELYKENEGECIRRYGPIEDWDVSNVINMECMFYGANAFNQTIGDWDISNVTNMDCMFCGAFAFDQPIGDWNVSKVTDMYCMFNRATAFNQPIGDWNVSKVTNMKQMFNGATAFNQPIGYWDVSHVTDMNSMFSYAEDFNQPIDYWNVSNMTNMNYMFNNCLISEENKPTFQ